MVAGIAWTRKDEEMLMQLRQTMSWDAAAEKMGRTAKSLKHRAAVIAKRGLQSESDLKKGCLWSAEEDERLKELSLSMTLKDIAPLMGRSQQAVYKHAESLGIKTNRNSAVYRRLLTLNDDFFSVPNLENSYWAGFIAADGNIGQEDNVLRIEIIHTDVEMLDAFCKATGCSATPKRRKGRNSVLLSVSGAAQWKTDLEKNFFVTPAKSSTLQPPAHLNEACARAYIIGYIDGDGCVRRDNRGYLSIGAVGTEALLLWIKAHFENICAPVSGGTAVRKFNHANCYQYTTTGKHAEEVYKVLKAHPVPYRLSRKWRYEV